ncbi:DUF4433 domain-containing protein [Halomonas sp. MCCC 1A17488]|uniref:DarT ssDNA thymidine ADP-ribosyltransferase family protein n=1 Tax=unclassified Halomonas TaxID=2609666 RepID=UPI0018D260E6|nr:MULTISPECIES: DarT ssDNA thymidine ADP-ribosyltransferase family protein [unclassified Halomonas]MCE8015933.1 DUF4433 domain-containing protein [Halomonas sp. MCCC 1A17488]MCG3239266.1 DUF4433 domain-containing protein [Halomonas sp. MCCC 1A17488]QPP50801.1 DUF4433 domain-containing protein [Halomonas sp. SS10-MC5]
MTGNELIARFNIQKLYHFTDTRNLPSIREQGGLLRLAEMKRRSVNGAVFGGNQWSHDADVARGLDGYVHLCFLSEHPMEWCAKNDGRILDSVFLQICPSVLNFSGVRVANDVSNKSGVSLLTLEEAAQQLDWEVLYGWTDWSDEAIKARRKSAKKYEVLVPYDIPLNLIGGI